MEERIIFFAKSFDSYSDRIDLPNGSSPRHQLYPEIEPLVSGHLDSTQYTRCIGRSQVIQRGAGCVYMEGRELVPPFTGGFDPFIVASLCLIG